MYNRRNSLSKSKVLLVIVAKININKLLEFTNFHKLLYLCIVLKIITLLRFICFCTGVKTLGERTVEYGEAKGLVYKLEHYDIYSNSWGPNDDGLTLGSVGHMTDEAFKDGITKV